MHRRPLHTAFAFVVVGVLAVVAVLITTNVLFAGPSSATVEANAATACASRLDGGFEVDAVYAEAEHRDQIATAAAEDGLFEFTNYVSAGAAIFYVTGTGSLGSGDAALVCTAVMVDGAAESTEYAPAASTWLR